MIVIVVFRLIFQPKS